MTRRPDGSRFIGSRGHQLGVPDLAYVGEVALRVVPADRTGEVTALDEAAEAYPPALSTTLVAGLWEPTFELAAAHKAIARADTVYVAGVIVHALLLCAYALHGRARRWLISEKGAIASAGRLIRSYVFCDVANPLLSRGFGVSGGWGSVYFRVSGMVVWRSSKARRWVGVGMARVGTTGPSAPYWMSLRVRVARWSSRARKERTGWLVSSLRREALRVAAVERAAGATGSVRAGGCFVGERQRGQGFAEVPGQVGGEHGDEHVGADPVFEAVVDGA